MWEYGKGYNPKCVVGLYHTLGFSHILVLISHLGVKRVEKNG